MRTTKLRLRRLVLVALSVPLLWAAAAGCSSYVRLDSPPPIEAASDPEITEQAILDALPRRGWTVEEIKPGEITAFLSVRDHWVRVSVRYDNSKIVIFYLDSDKLDYKEKDGVQYIHKSWKKWTHNLARDIQRAVKKRKAEGLAPTAPPTAGGAVAPQADPAAAPPPAQAPPPPAQPGAAPPPAEQSGATPPPSQTPPPPPPQ